MKLVATAEGDPRNVWPLEPNGGGGDKKRDLLNKLTKLKNDEGWGFIDFEELNFEIKEGRIIVKDSFEALGYGRSTHPVCHFLRGYLSGVLSFLGIDKIPAETKCIAKGDPHCEFEVK